MTVSPVTNCFLKSTLQRSVQWLIRTYGTKISAGASAGRTAMRQIIGDKVKVNVIAPHFEEGGVMGLLNRQYTVY